MAVGAVRAARAILREVRPAAVLGAGGYVAGPVGLAALAARTPLVLSEADSHLGITNRMLAPFAKRVCLAFPLDGRTGERYRVTGRPVPPPATDRAAARARFGLGADETCVLVFGGSLGARSINEAAIQGLAGAPYRVLHAAGERDMPSLVPRVPAGRLRPASLHRPLRRGAARLRPLRRALGRFDLRGRRARAPGDPRPLPARDRRPPGLQRPLDGRRRRRAHRARRGADARAAALARSTRCSGTPARLAAMARASAGLARPNAAADVAAEVLGAMR